MTAFARIATRISCAVLLLWGATAAADDYDTTIAMFKRAGESAAFFNDSYGYAVFPNVGKGGFVVGGGYGEGRVYRRGQYVGDTTVTQLSVGLQAGGQGYSQIVFFEDKRAFDDFTKGTFEIGADASAVAIKSSATATAGTAGPAASAGKNEDSAVTRGKYHKGFAIFTIPKGGAMAAATVAGQKFSYSPRDSSERVSSDQ
jgi:lipid-binding SYLF domain-containing protein